MDIKLKEYFGLDDHQLQASNQLLICYYNTNASVAQIIPYLDFRLKFSWKPPARHEKRITLPSHDSQKLRLK